MIKFTHISGFETVYKTVKYHYETNFPGMRLPKMTFGGSVKIHGCNGGIRRNVDGTYTAQSRKRDLAVGDDHYAFAAHLKTIPKERLDEHFSQYSGTGMITQFGEWAGPGIQGGGAVNLLTERQFIVYNAYDHDTETYYPNNRFIEMPEYNIYNVLRGGRIFIEVDMEDPTEADRELTRITLEVEANCPYGASFGLDGIGEGLVWQWANDVCNTDMWFKTKGKKHSNRKQKTSAPVDHEKLESIQECVDYIIGDVRLNQGLDHLIEMNIPLEKASLGAYLKWIAGDCVREDMHILEANGLEWKDIAKKVNESARNFFFNHIKAY